VKWTPKWDLSSIPDDKLIPEYYRRRKAGVKLSIGRRPLPRCAKCGAVKREGHKCK
jgi:hypothetical protein